MRIGVAIPCYTKHIPYLKICLDSIAAQSCLPDEVVVSCSSTEPNELPAWTYPFHLRILTHTDVYNTAKNRNIAAAALTTDIISFFDADDIMHPQRIEMIKYAFETHWCDIVLHAFFEEREHAIEFPQLSSVTLPLLVNRLMKSLSGCAEVIGHWMYRIHHAHVSVSAAMFRRVQFNEDPSIYIKADSDFCARVLTQADVRSVYLGAPLSRYVVTPMSLTVLEREATGTGAKPVVP